LRSTPESGAIVTHREEKAITRGLGQVLNRPFRNLPYKKKGRADQAKIWGSSDRASLKNKTGEEPAPSTTKQIWQGKGEKGRELKKRTGVKMGWDG